MKKVLIPTFVLALVVSAGSASAFSVFSTGLPIGSVGGTVDTNWDVTLPSLTSQDAVVLNHTGSDFPYTAYAANDASSQWISFMADGGNSLTTAQTAGNYIYTTSVDFTGSTGILSGHLWSDNALLSIKIGATDYGTTEFDTLHADNSTGWFLNGTNFSISGLSGVQTVAITVKNGFAGYSGANDPTAFRANLNLQPVPEPFTMTLGLAGAGLFIRRRLRKG